MKTQHTPGPWKIHAHQIMSDMMVIASIRYHTNHVENARLISAAPDLLSALEFLLADYIAIDGSTLTCSEYAVTKAQDAIAKAKGE